MPSIPIKLKPVGCGEWQLYAPAGHEIGTRFKGSEYEALQWGRRFVSTWYNWVVVLDKGDQDEKENRVSR